LTDTCTVGDCEEKPVLETFRCITHLRAVYDADRAALPESKHTGDLVRFSKSGPTRWHVMRKADPACALCQEDEDRREETARSSGAAVM
jgi:hypothetical protein